MTYAVGGISLGNIRARMIKEG
jgi:uncharacterized membrane protein